MYGHIGVATHVFPSVRGTTAPGSFPSIAVAMFKGPICLECLVVFVFASSSSEQHVASLCGVAAAHFTANPAVFPWEALRGALRGHLPSFSEQKKNLWFLLLSFLDTNQDEQAWPGGMTSPF